LGKGRESRSKSFLGLVGIRMHLFRGQGAIAA
jgi:hypothetical protein